MRMKRKYICDVCKQIFLRRRFFVQHVRRHAQKPEDYVQSTVTLKNILPKNWDHIVKSYEPHIQKNNFVATVLVSGLSTTDQIKEWMKEFMNINRCNYTLRYLDSRESRLAKSKHVYACRYLSRKCNKSSCQSCIRFVIKRNWENSAYFGIIHINYVHNHSSDCATILRYCTPSDDVQQYFRTMFVNGFSPSQAYNSYKQHLYVQYNDDFESALADRGINPDQRWVYYFYQKVLKERNNSTAAEHMITTVKTSVNEFNERHEQNYCYYEQLDEINFAVVLLTPLMIRASRLPQCGDVLYVDYESQVSRFGLHVFVLFAGCCVGGIPIGIIITSDDSEMIISKGFQYYRTIINVPIEPRYIVTGDYPLLRASLQALFPASRLLLNVFQILESTWKWLWKLENAVEAKYRKTFYTYVQRMVYATQAKIFDATFADLLLDEDVERYANFSQYVTSLYRKRNEWAICLLEGHPEYERIAKRIVDDCMKVFKEKMFKKLKSYNPMQLFNYIVNDFNTYYERKLYEVALNKNYNYAQQRTSAVEEEMSKYEIQYTADSVVMLTNLEKNVRYVVNEDVNVCSCYLGEVGLFCKHLLMLNTRFDKVRNYLKNGSISEEERKQLYYVADGTIYSNKNFIENQLIMVTEEEVDVDQVSIVVDDFVVNSNEKCQNDLDFCNGMETIKEEIVLMLDEDVEEPDEDELDSNESINSADTVDAQPVGEDNVTAFDQFQKLLEAFADRVRNDVPFYRSGLEAMNQRLRSLMQSPNNDVYSAMVEFGKDMAAAVSKA